MTEVQREYLESVLNPKTNRQSVAVFEEGKLDRVVIRTGNFKTVIEAEHMLPARKKTP